MQAKGRERERERERGRGRGRGRGGKESKASLQKYESEHTIVRI